MVPAVRKFLDLPAVVVKSVELVSKGDNCDAANMDERAEICDTGHSNDAGDTKTENDTKANLTDSQKIDIKRSELSGSSGDRTAMVGISDSLDSSNSKKAGESVTENSGIGNGVAAGGGDVVEGDALLGKEPGDKVSLTSPSPELRDSTLTVPLLPPPFLGLALTDQTSQVCTCIDNSVPNLDCNLKVLHVR